MTLKNILISYWSSEKFKEKVDLEIDLQIKSIIYLNFKKMAAAIFHTTWPQTIHFCPHTYFICPQPRIESSLLSRVLQRHSGAKIFWLLILGHFRWKGEGIPNDGDKKGGRKG